MTTIVKGHIASLNRLRSSVSGNPRYRINLAEGQVFPTEPDASFVFGLESVEYLGEPFAYVKPLVRLTVNGRGNVENIDIVKTVTIIQHSCLYCQKDVDVVGSPFGPICNECGRFNGISDRLLTVEDPS